jgi:3-oxoacyl-[acyl-carrier protein] reductase
MTISQAKELGPFGIRVGAIAPGFIDTPSTLNAMGIDALKKLKRNIPLRRLGQVSEVCHAAVFIVENQYYTGSVLELNGGLTI